MPSTNSGIFRKLVPIVATIAVMAGMFMLARVPTASAGDRRAVAARYGFTELPIAFPDGYRPDRTVRNVNPAYENIKSWISSVGAGVAINDLTGSGKAQDLCLVDPRTDQVVITPAPGTGNRYKPFILDPAPLPMDDQMAPMGCVLGNFKGDGRMDIMVYYWGRTPVLFLSRADATTLSPAAYKATELVPQPSSEPGYHGPRWNSNSATVADFDGDGHPDIFIGNYFPESAVLNPKGRNDVTMQHSMSLARNAGKSEILRWVDATSGSEPTATFQIEPNAIPPDVNFGWTLASAAADLDGDMLPELYIANDFGPDRLLHNTSTRGHISFQPAVGHRDAVTPKSLVLGKDSFKGMGVDFGQLSNNPRFDIFVSNITTSFGLQESNFAFINDARDEMEMRRNLERGIAPFTERSRSMGMAWTGWCWDAKIADFDNSGDAAIVQTAGFVRGETSRNRWAWLQELAMTNDELLSDPKFWPNLKPGDDISGRQHIAFYAKMSGGKYVDISTDLGLAAPEVSRGIAVGDSTGSGALDIVVARQWAAPSFYHNNNPTGNSSLELGLYLPVTDTAQPRHGLHGPGVPAIGAQARVHTADGKVHLAQVDGGSGHSGKRSFEVHVGLGKANATPVSVDLRWRDKDGTIRQQTIHTAPGRHNFLLGTQAQEVTK